MTTVTSPIATLIAIGLSSWIIHKYKRHWFLIDQASRNPYQLVYKVIKFATQHKTLIHRSAFTYCEDELPSRMDLGKDKYGGPFTTEQVEYVKAFLGIMVLLLPLGLMLSTDIAVLTMLSRLFSHLNAQGLEPLHWLPVLMACTGLGDLVLLIPFVSASFDLSSITMLNRIGLGIYYPCKNSNHDTD